MGCWRFWNHRHILQVSQDGEWVNGGKFPPSCGSFATFPRQNRVTPLIVYATSIYITFSDCLSIGGYLLLFWLTGLPGTIGPLAFGLSHQIVSLPRFVSLGWPHALLHRVSIVTVMLSFLGLQLVSISLITTQRSSPPLSNASHTMALLNPTWRWWCFWPVHIS